MKKLYYSLFAALFSVGVQAQVTVTYEVDVTNYVVDYTVGETGMRIAGDFIAEAEANGEAGAGWDPVAAFSAMTDLGDNIWSISVTYPESAIGSTQLYKFVNENWGSPGEANEGGDASTIATDECGVDDGEGNINRTLVIPDADVTLRYCWEACTQCDGSDPINSISEINAIAELNVFPNPVNETTQISYTLGQTNKVSVRMVDLLGKEVSAVFEGTQSFGEQILTVDMSTYESGIYFFQVSVGSQTTVSKVVKR